MGDASTSGMSGSYNLYSVEQRIAIESIATAEANRTQTSRRRVLWSSQFSADNSWNENKNEEWKPYSDIENQLIEDVCEKKEQEQFQLGDYTIDFIQMTEIRKNDDGSIQERSIKRDETEFIRHLRTERFCCAEEPKVARSFSGAQFWGSEFISNWRKRNEELWYDGLCWAEIVEQAVKGILQEGQLLDKINMHQARLITNQLSHFKNKPEHEILEQGVRLYTAETFLYKLVNSTLRNEDISKVDTLGAYCFILQGHLWSPGKDHEDITVYRGTDMNDQMIEQYKLAAGSDIRYLAFTSTTKDRQVAEMYSNVNALFIIKLNNSGFLRDISSISFYPDEEEVLLNAGHPFKVIQVEYDLKKNRYLIHLSCFAI